MRIDYKHSDGGKFGGFGVVGRDVGRVLTDNDHTITEVNPDIHFRYIVPEFLHQEEGLKNRNKPLIVWTLWESSHYPDEWVDILREWNVDLIITSTQFTADSIKRHGFKNVAVVHNGYNPFWKEMYCERDWNKPIQFIHWNGFEDRKGWEYVIQAFVEEFGDSSDVKLVIKARDKGESVMLTLPEQDNIEYKIGQLELEEFKDLVVSSHVGVFPVKGEGWFLPSVEFSVSGGLVMLPNDMGLTEQWADGYIDIEREGYFYSTKYSGAQMKCSVEDLRKKMRWVLDNRDTCKAMSKNASMRQSQVFDWQYIYDNQLSKLINKYNGSTRRKSSNKTS